MTTGTLGPLVLLDEPDDLPQTALPADLRHLYGGDLGFAPRCLVTNFVSTIDGVVAIPSVANSNRLISDGSDADRFVMGLLRAFAGVVVIGSGVMRAAPESLWTPEQAYRPAQDAYAALRRDLGLAERPEVAVVTGSGSIDPTHPALEHGAAVLTTARGASSLRRRLPTAADVVELPGDDLVDIGAAVAALRERGHDLVLSEAGPTVFGSLLGAELVDELFLTVSPLLAGRDSDGRRSLVEGVELLPRVAAGSQLIGARRHDDHLFLRYRI